MTGIVASRIAKWRASPLFEELLLLDCIMLISIVIEFSLLVFYLILATLAY